MSRKARKIFGLGPATKNYIAVEAVDMRKREPWLQCIARSAAGSRAGETARRGNEAPDTNSKPFWFVTLLGMIAGLKFRASHCTGLWA